MAVGGVYDGAVAAAVAADPVVGVDAVVIPVVGECDDSWLNDARTVQVEAADARRALADAGASTSVAQGAVGAGTGMMCFDWKGGIGSASRRVGDTGHTVGVLVLANFGSGEELRVDGVPVGRLLGGAAATGPPAAAGSRIAIVATDAPLASSDLIRLARRAGLGWAARARPPITEAARSSWPSRPCAIVEAVDYDPLFRLTVDATEEAVLNALWNAERTDGRDGRYQVLPYDEVLALLEAHAACGAEGQGGCRWSRRRALDALRDVVADVRDPLDGQRLGVGEIPVEIALARDERAFVAAAHRHHDVGFGELFAESPRPPVAEIDAELCHRSTPPGGRARPASCRRTLRAARRRPSRTALGSSASGRRCGGRRTGPGP